MESVCIVTCVRHNGYPDKQQRRDIARAYVQYTRSPEHNTSHNFLHHHLTLERDSCGRRVRDDVARGRAIADGSVRAVARLLLAGVVVVLSADGFVVLGASRRRGCIREHDGGSAIDSGIPRQARWAVEAVHHARIGAGRGVARALRILADVEMKHVRPAVERHGRRRGLGECCEVKENASRVCAVPGLEEAVGAAPARCRGRHCRKQKSHSGGGERGHRVAGSACSYAPGLPGITPKRQRSK